MNFMEIRKTCLSRAKIKKLFSRTFFLNPRHDNKAAERNYRKWLPNIVFRLQLKN